MLYNDVIEYKVQNINTFVYTNSIMRPQRRCLLSNYRSIKEQNVYLKFIFKQRVTYVIYSELQNYDTYTNASVLFF